MAHTFKDTNIKYLSDDELHQRTHIKRNSIRKIRTNIIRLKESQTELQFAISNYKGSN